MSRGRTVIVLVMLILLAVTLTGAFLTRGVMADLPFLQARKGSWTGAYVPLGIVDQRPWQTVDSGGPGTVGGGKEACQGRRASCGSRNRPGVLAITKAGKPCTTKAKRQGASIAKKGQRASGDCQER